ncbi:hypothetical protein CTAYLR_003050 [Chrysophaeum taylorii]|uniref:Uncharacterized protein n=1 Tax=Chrysophaeum taylorii TaxID=2483200 RepID=A0AAD7U5V2_9STRA|nr:hypothetical protein CTAYLR_003050 [Chrysophaeum taylorii]
MRNHIKSILLFGLLFTDLMMNSSLEYDDYSSYPTMFGIQLFVVLCSFVVVFLMLCETYPFRVGLIGALHAEFREVFWLHPSYFFATLFLGLFRIVQFPQLSAGRRHFRQDNGMWDTTTQAGLRYTTISHLHKLLAAFYYFANVRAAVRLVITSLNAIADALCARLLVEPPCHLLGGSHGKVSCALDWSAFVLVTTSEGREVSLSQNDFAPQLGSPRQLHGCRDATVETAWKNRSSAWFWDIKDEWYTCRKQKNLSKLWKHATQLGASRCVPPKVESSRMVKRVATLFIEKTLGNKPFVQLHLRRGDAVHQCDTSVPVVLEYVECSLVVNARTSNVTLLLNTDDTNANGYVTRVMDALRRSTKVHFADVLHLDAALRNASFVVDHNGARQQQSNVVAMLLRSDNLFLFGVETEIMARASLALVRRRNKHCVPCEGY